MGNEVWFAHGPASPSHPPPPVIVPVVPVPVGEPLEPLPPVEPAAAEVPVPLIPVLFADDPELLGAPELLDVDPSAVVPEEWPRPFALSQPTAVVRISPNRIRICPPRPEVDAC